MTPPKKPEWIQIADTDNAASVSKVSKALPAIALGSALMIIGAGVVFAQSHDEQPAAAVESVVASAQPVAKNSAQSANTAASATPSMRAQNVVVQKVITKSDVVTVATQSPVVTPKAPGIQAPTGRDGDDEGEGEGGGHQDGARARGLFQCSRTWIC
jgi:hypothetical protein